MNNIILHIPHSSTYIALHDGYVINDEILNKEIDLLTDWFTDELFDLPYAKIISLFSRIFCDVERFADDSLEVMAQYGMGMCYSHLDNGDPMRIVSPKLRSKIKSGYYDTHHKSLENSCSEALKEHEKVLIIDCHSFPDKPLYRDLSQHMPRPDFCIGSDEYHTPRELISSSIAFLNGKGFDVKENDPFSGTMIPMKYYRQDKNVLGVMIEVNRKLYINESNGIIEKSKNFNNIHQLIKELINHIQPLPSMP